MKNSAAFKDYLLLHFVILLWGFTPVLGKLISLQAIELVWWRLLFSALSLYLFARAKGMSMRVKPIVALELMGWGLVVGTHWFFFYHAIKVSNVSVTMMGFSSITLFASVLQPLLLKKPFFWGDLIYGVVIVIGLIIIQQHTEMYAEGMIYGVLAAFFGALFGIYNGKLIAKHEAGAITFYEFTGAFLLLTMVHLVDTQFASFEVPVLSDVIFLLILSIVCTTLAFTLSVQILKKIDPLTVIITNNLEPIYGVVFSVILFGSSEYMSRGFYVGAMLLIAAVFSYPLLKRRFINSNTF